MRDRRKFLRSGICPPREQAFSVQALAAGPFYPLSSQTLSCKKTCSLSMSRLLAEEGAQLVISQNDSTPFAYVMFPGASQFHVIESFIKLEHFFSNPSGRDVQANPPARLLELGLDDRYKREQNRRLEMFEYLLSQGADVRPGCPLAVLIRNQGSKELVERVLRLGASPYAYCCVGLIMTLLQAAAFCADECLVTLLLDLGANVNNPARGKLGFTALQAIYIWDPVTQMEHYRKMRIYSVLISNGADVNASASSKGGITVLGAAAMRRDLEMVVDLLSRGACVNTKWLVSWQEGCRRRLDTALDVAAGYGRLDVVKLLLNANALSAVRGSSGYE